MRFLEVPALITEDIEDPDIDIVDITEPITASISGTTLTIDGDSKVSGEVTITLTNDVTVDTVTTSNIRQPSIHKITIKTNGVGNFTYTPNAGVTASSVSTTTKTGSDLEILLITTSSGETYLDLDLADYVSPAANFSNVLTGFNVSDLTSAYGTTAKLYKPDGTLLTTVNSATTGSGVNFGYTETEPGDVIYKLEVTDDLGRKSKYNLPRKWINYAMETTSTPGFQKFALEGNEYTSTVTVPNLSSSSKARIHKTTDHGYMGIKFRIQGRNSPSDDWVDVDDTGENENADESAEFLAFGNYKYQRVWVKPTAKATTTVSSSNVVTLTLSNVTEDVTTKTITGMDPFHVDETSNVFVFEETAKIGTIPYTVTVGTETYTNAVTATTEEVGSTPNTDMTAAGPNMKHQITVSSLSRFHEVSADGKFIAWSNQSGVIQVMKGDPESGYTNYTTFTHSQSTKNDLVGSISYDGKYIINGCIGVIQHHEIWKHDESTGTYSKLSQTAPEIGNENRLHKPSFVPRSGNYDFAVTGTDNNNTFRVQLYKHNAGTDTWTAQTEITDVTSRPTSDGGRARYAKQFTQDGRYLMVGSTGTYGGYEMYTVDWDANTVVFSGANYVENGSIGHSGTVTLDGKYVLIFHNDSNSRKIFKNNDAGDWSSATDVTTDFAFENTDDDQGHDISFCGENSEFFVSGMYSGNLRMYSWYAKKEITLTYNGKDMLTLAHKGGLTTTSVKLYKDDVLYHTFGASETSVVIAEAGVYQAIADDKYYSLKVTVTTVTETLARLYLNRFACFLIKKDGKVWYWGESNYGANAMGNNTQVALPTLNDNLNALPSGIKQIGRCGTDAHASCAITNDGKLYTWGYNGHGQLGRGNTTDYTSQGPWLVSTQSSNTFTFCHSSYYTNYAIQDNGYIWSCGYNGQYVIGNGNNSNISTFYRINLPNVIDIHANYNIALALTSDGKVYIWGTESDSCMAGIGTTGTPTHMTALDGKNIVKVRTGGYTGHAISSDGKIYSWGKGQYYAIPDGTTNNVGTPTEMTWFSRKNIKLVDAQFPYDEAAACLALDDQGNMYVWGPADHGAIGDGPDMPVYEWPFLLRGNIASISVGRHSCGCIDKFGQVYTWGDGLAGQQNWIHGSNSDTDINIPTSNNLSVGSSVVYDGFDKYLLGKDSTVTSNVTFGSNTVSLGTKSEVFISDPHTYKFKIMESGKTTYTSTVISSTPTRPTGRVYPPKSGTHKNHTARSTSANTDLSWNIDGALYGSGDYTASCSKTLHSNNAGPFECFDGLINETSCHLNTSQTAPFDIQLHMPQKIKLTKYAMYSRSFTGEYNNAPKDWKVYGSNDKTNWTELDSQTNEAVTAWGSQTDLRDTKREYTVTGNTKYFSSYKLDISATGTSTYGIISQIEYYGDEEGFLSDDGFGKLTIDVKGDSSATSNITFHSNTYVMGAARDLYITDTGEYSADIYGSNKHFLGSKTHTVSANATEFIWKENEDQILYASDAAASDHFGTSVAIRGDYAISSAYSDDGEKGSAYIFYKSGGTWTQQTKLVASDAAGSDRFGWSVDIDGDYAIIGAEREDDPTDSGSAYIFKRSGTSWTQQVKLKASDAAASDYFGYSVAISGDYAIVGTFLEDDGGTDAGAAYIFKRASTYVFTGTSPSTITLGGFWYTNFSRWYQKSTSDATSSYVRYILWNSSGQVGADYGTSFTVNSSGDLILDVNDSTGGSSTPFYFVNNTTSTTVSSGTGAVSVGDSIELFTSGNTSEATFTVPSVFAPTLGDVWSQQQKILSSDIGAGDRFGCSVSLSGDYAIVGAQGEDVGGSDAGAAYVYKRDGTTWSQQSKLMASDKQADDNFGNSVSLSGDYAIVGARTEDTGGSNIGAAYVYKRDGTTWSEQQKIQASDAQASDQFGYSVNISGDHAIVGAYLEDTGGSDAGAAYIFERSGTTWTEVKKITASDAQASDNFGQTVAIDGTNVIVGARGEDTKGSNAGAAYIFEKGAKAVPALNFDGYNKLSIDNVSFSANEWPPTDGTASSFSVSNSNRDATWTISGASYGNGTYTSKWSGNIIDANRHSGKAFNKIYGGNENFHTNGTGAGNLDLELPEAFIMGSYDMRHRSNINTNENAAPKDWVISGSNDGSTWTVLDTQTGQVYSPDVAPGGETLRSYTVTGNTTAYKHYRMYITSNDGGSHIIIGELRYYAQQTVATTSTIKKDGAAFATTTSNTVYIREAGTYTAEVKGSGAYVTELSKVVSGDVTSNLEWKSNETQVLYPDSVTTEDLFGNSIAFDGNYAIIGANNNDFGGDNRGMVYIFYKSGGMWTKQANFQSKHINNVDNFGWSVDISGDYAIIGAFLYDEVFPDAASNRGAAYIFKREGNEWRQQTQLQPSDPGADDYFGYSVKISGDYAIVGSPYNNDPTNSGSAYIFKKTSTTLSTVINPIFTDASTIETNANWSSSTGFEITESAVGASQPGYQAFDNTYTADNAWESTWLSGSNSMPAWIQIQYPQDVVIKSYTIVGRDATDRYYPTSWQLQGATASAPSTYVNLETTGSNRTASGWAPLAEVSYNVNTPGTAYRYFRLYVNSSNENNQVSINELKLYTEPLSGQSGTVEDSWVQQQKLTANDAATYDEFGLSVDISGDYAIIGANSGDQRPGSAYIFKLSGTTWTQQDKIQASDGATSERFGKAVALSGDYAVVGAYNDNSGTGSAYIFKKDTGAETWTEQQKLTASDGASNDNFGWSVDIYGETAVVGAYRKNSYTGAAYIFERSGSAWTEVKNITASGGAGGNFGNEVFVDGTTVLIGSPNTDTKGTNTGACYVFNKTPPGPYATYDNYNKITLNQLNYADTTNVTYYSNTYELGTAKTMYVKDAGEYVFKINGTDKYVDSNVYVSSVDLAGATTKPISFDGYNKLTLISPGTNAVSNLTYFSNTYDMGSASTFYIKDTGTYDLEMSGSNVFALSSNVVNTISEPAVSGTHRFPLDSGTLTDSNNGSVAFGSGATFEAPELRKDSKTSYKLSVGQNKNVTLPSALSNWCVSMWVFIPYVTSYGGSSNSSNIPSDFSSHTSGGYSWSYIWTWHMANGREFRHRTVHDSHIYEYASASATSSESVNMYHSWDSSIGSGSKQNWHPGNSSNNMFMPEAWHHMAWEYNGTTGKFKWYCDGIERTTAEVTMTTGCSLNGMTFGDSTPNSVISDDTSIWWYISDLVIAPSWNIDTYNLTKGTYKHFLPIPQTLGVRQLRGEGTETSVSSPSLTFDNYNKLTVSNFTTTDIEWPPASFTSPTFSGSTITGVTTTNNAKDQTWTISGAAYGNGEYSASFDGTVLSNVNYHGPVRCFDKVNDGHSFHSHSVPTGIVTLNMPENIILSSYELRHRPNANTSENYAPRDWTLEASNDGTTWVVLDTQSNQSYNPDVQGDEVSKRTYTVSNNSTSYSRYRLNITANDGGVHLVIGQWKLFVSNTRTATLTDPNGSTYALGKTQDTIYIKDTGNYTLDVQNNDQKAIVAKTVTGVLGSAPISFTIFPSSISLGGHWQNNYGPATYTKTSHTTTQIVYDLTGSAILSALGGSTTAHGIKFNATSSGIELDVENADDDNTPHTFTSTTITTATSSGIVTVGQSISLKAANGNEEATFTVPDFGYNSGSPSLNFDTYNKLTIANVDSDATSNIDFFSNTYEMGSRKELIINDAGTYHANIYSSNTLALVKNDVGAISDWETSNIFGFPLTSSIPTASNYSGVSTITQGAHCEINSGSLKATNSAQSANDRTLYFHTVADYEEFTVTFDFNLSEVGSEDGVFFSAEDTASNMLVELQKYGANTIRPQIQSSLNPTFTQTSGFSDWAKLTFMAFNKTSSRPGRVKIYIDDVLKLNQEATTWTTSDLKFKYFTLLGGRPDGRWALPNARMKNFKFYNHTTLYDASPSLTFDGYNKLTAPVLESTFTATRLSDWDNNNQSKSPNSGKGDWPGTSFTGESDAHWWTLHNNDKVYTSSYNYGTTRDAAQLFTTVTSSDWNHAYHTQTGWNATKILKLGYKFTVGSKTLGSMKLWQAPASYPTGDVTIKYWDGTSLKTVTNQSPSGFPSSISYYTEQEFTFNSANAQYWLIECKTHASSPSTNYIGLAGWQLLSGRDPVSTVLTKGSDSYDIGTASSIYITDTGTYDAQAKNSNTFVIKTSNVVSGSITRSQIWNGTETQILYASDAQASDDFGWSVSIDGDYAIVGARYEDTGGSSAGAVYIFKRDGTSWSQQQIIHASDAQTNDQFGLSVGISGDYAIVGAPYEDKGADNGGSVYIYKRNTSTGVWGSEQNITASNAGGNDYFGISVSISGDYAIVGANGENSASGAVYIYKRNTSTGSWGSEQLIRASDAQGVDEFGWDVSISGDYAIVGSRNEDTGGTDAGAAYIYVRSGTTWSEQQKIQSSDIQAGDSFGGAVAIDGDYVTVGANYEDENGTSAGAAYIFKRDGTTWTQQAKLLPSDGTGGDELSYGGSIDISGDTVVVGARVADPGSISNAGAAYIFERSGTTWTEVKKITASDGQANDEFGISVAIDGTTVFVGARTEDTKGSDAGAAYVYEKTYVGPTLTYDNANKLSLTGVTTPSSNLTVGTNTYDIGSAKDVYIKDQGTYKFHTNDGDQALIMNKTVSSDPSGGVPGELDTVVAFHQGTFSNGGDPYSHGSVAAAATAGYVYSDTAAGTYTWGTLVSATDTAATGTPQGLNFVAAYTTYSWTPPNALTGARTLCVAGGGGGGADTGGGGGAGGYLEASDQSMSGTQTIIVGGGGDGIRRNYNDSCYYGGNGGDSSISGTSQTSIGGGGGGSRHDTNGSNHEARAGGSGGGASGRTGSVGGAGTAGQGYEGASSTTSHYCCGGGGASEAGTWGANSSTQADGGDGKSSDILGTTYWWSGGGGGAEHSNPKGSGGKGGGGVGAWGAGTSTVGGSPDTNGVSDAEASPGTDAWHQRGGNAGKHTGGGGGGGSHHNAGGGGHGGSGMVAIKFSKGTKDAPAQVYDNTKTITVSNIPSGTSTVGKIYKGATAYTIHATEPTSNVIIKNTGSYVSVFTTSSSAYLTNTVNVNATPTTTSDDNTIEDEAPVVTATATVSATVAFHHGTFADSDDPHSDGSITAAATAGHIYSDTAPGTYTWGTLTSGTVNAPTGQDSGASRGNHTPGDTTYKWTPPGTITGARMLLVGGGGGAGMNMGGGGGAGGFLAIASKDIPASEQTVVVGRGGIGAPGQNQTNILGQQQGSDNNSYNTPAYNGGDSSISSEIAYGGGSGGYSHNDDDRQHGGNGGSGGGVSGYGSGTRNNPGGTGVSGQGNAGGSSNSSHYSGGGGGAGEAGASANNEPKGGDGLSSDILGTEYWWSGGGGGSGYSGNGGDGGKGGGGGGAVGTNPGGTGGLTAGGAGGGGSINIQTNTPGGHAGKHTGGGGGGGAHYQGNNYGGNGGSGIVVIKFTAVSGSGESIAGSTAVASSSTTTDAPSTVLVATTEVAAPTMNLDFTANMSTFPRNLKRYNNITSSSIGARFNRSESKKKRVHKSINTDTFSIELTANNMGDSSSSTSTLPVTVVNSGAGTQYTSGWTTAGSTSSFVVPSDAPNALYYYSQNDDSAGGSISVSSASTTTHAITVVSSSAGTQYTSGWTASGTPGSSSGINTFIAPSNAPSTLFYYCGNHSGMGGAINMVSGPVSTTFTVTVQSVSGYYGGSSNYYFIDGTQQATISLVRGKTYTFNNNASGSHPMYFATSSDGTTYTSGVTNGGSSSVTFAVPLNAPSTLYYKCGVHGGMGGTIHILGPTASPLAVTVAGGKFVIGGVSQATLQLVRGETYVFNQENSTNGTHPLRLSTTSNGTHVSGGSGFYIGGTQRPTLSMVRGNTYTFDQTNASNGSHVFQIATASDGTQYTTGYTTGTFVVPLSAPDTLYYKSSTTSGMGGLINVTGSSTSAFNVTFSGGKFSIGGVQQDSLSVIRGLTYTFNQISGHVLSLSSTSDGTRNTGVNKYYISGEETPTLTFIRGSTYTFTQATSTNTNHPIRLSTTSNGTHASGSQYTSGWTTTGTPGSSGASSQFIVPANAPNTLYYYCQHHSGMGGTGSINVADSNSGIILTYGSHALVANSTVSGEYTIATNFDGTTSNLYVNNVLISQTTPTIASGAKTLKIGEDYNGLIKNLKFWNYAKRFFIPVLISPKFSSTTVLASDYNSTYGWDTNSGWEVSASTTNGGGEGWEAFNKVHNENNIWHSGNSSGNMASTPQLISIKYPIAVTVFKYKLWERGRSSDDNRWFPHTWKLQGSNDGSSWTDIGSEQQEDSWPYTSGVSNMKEYTVSNTTAYTRYRLRFTNGRYNNSTTNQDYNYVCISGWELYSQES